jgi:glyoxylase-like metal-dependent hydrolase (beta-lactamase superfamily II)
MDVQPAAGISEVQASGIELIDLGFMDTPGVIAAYLLVGDDGLTLIETGPATTRRHLEEGLRNAGYSLGDVSRIIVTHIHLDHGGAAGVIMRDHPHIRLSVHPVGAPHMVDPTRLVVSAGRIYGDQMDRLFGEIIGVPADRVDVLTDGEIVDAGGRTLRMLFTPGHASHHVAILDERSGTLFMGDVGGARLQGYDFIAPTTTPPEFVPEQWADSIDTVRNARATRLALTHFGFFDDVDAHLDRLMPGLEAVIALARETLVGDGGLKALAARLLDFEREGVAGPDASRAMQQLELAIPTYVAALGLQRYLKKRGELD